MDEELRVSAVEVGLRLDRFLALRVPGLSRGHLQGLIARGRVRVDGAVRPPDSRLKEGETVTLSPQGPLWAPVPFEDWVLHEDGQLLALDKPAGLLMHPAGESWLQSPRAALDEAEPSLAGLLLLHRPGVAAAGVPRCGIVHRLDRGTSGVLVVAKTSRVREILVAAFAERRVLKAYRAIVRGRLERSVNVEAPVGRPAGRRRIQVTRYGRQAMTDFRVLGRGRGATLITARPLTGRTHQIRAHLAHIRHPVLGDPEWDPPPASGGAPAPPRMMLHAWKLTVPHPRTGKDVTFTAPPPKDFRECWNRLRRAASSHVEKTSA